MKKTLNSPIIFFLKWLALVLILEACGGAASSEPQTGMDAIAATGRWMSVLEPVQDADPQVSVVDLDSGSPWLTLPDAEIYSSPITVFSPSGDYLLYRGSGMWQLVEIQSQSTWPVAPTSMHVEFLYDDEILISDKKEGLYEVSRLYPGQENPSPITSNGRYIFQSRPNSRISSSSFAGNAPNQPSCPSATAATWDPHVIVDSDWTAWVFAIGSDIRILQSASLKELFSEHESQQREIALQQLQATPDTANWTEDQKTLYIDLLVYSGISGLVSPDGKYLLILTTTAPENKYSLYLIDLAKNREEDGIKHLSTESNWAPSFLFSPDGSQVIYESNHDGGRAWYMRTLDESNPIQLKLRGVETLCWQ